VAVATSPSVALVCQLVPLFQLVALTKFCPEPEGKVPETRPAGGEPATPDLTVILLFADCKKTPRLLPLP